MPEKSSPDSANARQNRDRLKAAAIALHNAFPEWTNARIAANIGVSKTTVWRFLNEDGDAASAEQPKPTRPGSTRPVIAPNGTQLTLASIDGVDQPSKAFGTAASTASIISEREAIASLKIAAKEMELGARKLGKTADQLDALLKTAFVKGTQTAKELGVKPWPQKD